MATRVDRVEQPGVWTPQEINYHHELGTIAARHILGMVSVETIAERPVRVTSAPEVTEREVSIPFWRQLYVETTASVPFTRVSSSVITAPFALNPDDYHSKDSNPSARLVVHTIKDYEGGRLLKPSLNQEPVSEQIIWRIILGDGWGELIGPENEPKSPSGFVEEIKFGVAAPVTITDGKGSIAEKVPGESVISFGKYALLLLEAIRPNEMTAYGSEAVAA